MRRRELSSGLALLLLTLSSSSVAKPAIDVGTALANIDKHYAHTAYERRFVETELAWRHQATTSAAGALVVKNDIAEWRFDLGVTLACSGVASRCVSPQMGATSSWIYALALSFVTGLSQTFKSAFSFRIADGVAAGFRDGYLLYADSPLPDRGTVVYFVDESTSEVVRVEIRSKSGDRTTVTLMPAVPSSTPQSP